MAGVGDPWPAMGSSPERARRGKGKREGGGAGVGRHGQREAAGGCC
jgi:hypothetical protein